MKRRERDGGAAARSGRAALGVSALIRDPLIRRYWPSIDDPVADLEAILDDRRAVLQDGDLDSAPRDGVVGH